MWEEKWEKGKGKMGRGVGARGRSRRVGFYHGVGHELMLEHGGCYWKLNVMR